uniref:Growth arrest-specific protein 7 n=1 Tax=Sphaerodactylus townsendi TaxID=933632 RepID=A0ACB8EJU2_9SAUR
MPPPGQERAVPALGARCRTLYPFSGERHRHGLRFAAGELLTFLQAGPDGGWWEGETAEGLRGWFPASYVQLIECLAKMNLAEQQSTLTTTLPQFC